MENNLSKKEQYDLGKQQEQTAQTRAVFMKKIRTLAIVVAGIVLVAVLAFFFVTTRKEPGTDYSLEMPFEGQSHVAEGTDIKHQSNPPTSGNHWPTPLKDGVYKTEKPDEAVIHSMEHGRVWISYKPSLSPDIIKQLEKLGSGQALIVTPRNANETDIALAAWTRLDTFNLNVDGTLDEQRVLNFINRYKNKGPEFVPGSTSGKTYE